MMERFQDEGRAVGIGLGSANGDADDPIGGLR